MHEHMIIAIFERNMLLVDKGFELLVFILRTRKVVLGLGHRVSSGD